MDVYNNNFIQLQYHAYLYIIPLIPIKGREITAYFADRLIYISICTNENRQDNPTAFLDIAQVVSPSCDRIRLYYYNIHFS